MILKVTLICLAVIVVSSNLIDASVQYESEAVVPVAEDRTFLAGKKSGGKKSWVGSLMARPAEPEDALQTIPAPFGHYPIWKVHKYRGIELRPVHVLPVPAIQTEPVTVPHSGYGVPHTEYGVPEQFNGQFALQTGPLTSFPVASRHPHKLRAFLGLLNKLRSLKRWKIGLKQDGLLKTSRPVEVYSLPEVADVSVQGLENLDIHVPELPAVGVPSYFSTISTVPYLNVKPVSASTYEEYPPQSPPAQVYQPVEAYEEPHAPAPYYGAPPMFDSYGTPLSQDVYSSAPSDHVPAFVTPDAQSAIVSSEPAVIQDGIPNNAIAGQVQGSEEPLSMLGLALNGTEWTNQRVVEDVVAQNKTQSPE